MSRHLEAGLCRRLCCAYKGSPTVREARKTMQETGSRSRRRDRNVYNWGSPTRREAHYKDQHTRGSRFMPEVLLHI